MLVPTKYQTWKRDITLLKLIWFLFKCWLFELLLNPNKSAKYQLDFLVKII